MSDAPTRRIVKPAHPGACIPDPAHRKDLPQAGAEVVWDHYWIGRLNRGEVVIVEPEAAKPVRERSVPTVGDVVQWTSNGIDQFASPLRVTAVQGDHLQVEGSPTGIPLAECSVIAVEPHSESPGA